MFNWIATAFVSIKNVLVGTAIVFGLVHMSSTVVPITAQIQEPVVVATSSMQEDSSITPTAIVSIKKITSAAVSTQTVVLPATSTLQSPQQTDFITPNGAVINAQGQVLNQDQIDAQNAQEIASSTATQNTLRLQQAQAAASSSQAILKANAAALKAKQIKNIQNQMTQVQFNITQDEQILLNLREEEQVGGISSYQSMLINNGMATTTDDITQQQINLQNLQIQLDVLNQ